MTSRRRSTTPRIKCMRPHRSLSRTKCTWCCQPRSPHSLRNQPCTWNTATSPPSKTSSVPSCANTTIQTSSATLQYAMLSRLIRISSNSLGDLKTSCLSSLYMRGLSWTERRCRCMDSCLSRNRMRSTVSSSFTGREQMARWTMTCSCSEIQVWWEFCAIKCSTGVLEACRR